MGAESSALINVVAHVLGTATSPHCLSRRQMAIIFFFILHIYYIHFFLNFQYIVRFNDASRTRTLIAGVRDQSPIPVRGKRHIIYDLYSVRYIYSCYLYRYIGQLLLCGYCFKPNGDPDGCRPRYLQRVVLDMSVALK